MVVGQFSRLGNVIATRGRRLVRQAVGLHTIEHIAFSGVLNPLYDAARR
jgi:hypothetical protein